jgi:hypothetical protein
MVLLTIDHSPLTGTQENIFEISSIHFYRLAACGL